MTQWIALAPSLHAEKAYLPRQDFYHTAGQPFAPVLLHELHKLLSHYVLGFIDSGNGLLPVAVLGVEAGQNLYLKPDGKWLGQYVPAELRGYPFTLADNQSKGGERTLCIASEHLHEDGEPLFENGELTKPVADILKFLSQCEHSRRLTREVSQALQTAGVLTPWKLKVPIGDSHQKIKGMYRVDENALNNLDAETYITLQGGPMQLAYAQLFSMNQISRLAELAKYHAQQAQKQASSEPDIEQLFGEDDTLNFDNI